MIIRNCKNVLLEFRQSRGQQEAPPKIENKTSRPSRTRRDSTPYDGFLQKYRNLEDTIDSLE